MAAKDLVEYVAKSLVDDPGAVMFRDDPDAVAAPDDPDAVALDHRRP